VVAYGDDPYTAAAEQRFREHFGEQAVPFLVFNGTGANVLALLSLCRSYDAVICPQTAHLNVDECGAPERIAGVKLLTVDTRDGKLTPELVAERIARVGDQHASQPRAVSISQATELGTVYTPEEVGALAELAHEHGMLLHIDGARLANAAAGLGLSLRALTTDAGADAVSFGGTKNGLLLGDAVVFLRPELARDFRFVRKQSMQLASKMRFLAAQFEALLGGDLWHRNASHANAMARRLAEAISAIDGARIAYPVEANGVFVSLPAAAIERLRSSLPGELPFHVWDETAGIVRLMCSWDTTTGDVDGLASALATAVG
jgi:threonine aldolase